MDGDRNTIPIRMGIGDTATRFACSSLPTGPAVYGRDGRCVLLAHPGSLLLEATPAVSARALKVDVRVWRAGSIAVAGSRGCAPESTEGEGASQRRLE